MPVVAMLEARTTEATSASSIVAWLERLIIVADL
jgi:hypothetical protein